MKHINISITGLVQGVGFRNSAKHQARYLGIKGFIQNRVDGSVYVEAEGDSAALVEFVKWCKKGPPFSEVEEVRVQEGVMKHFASFDTSY
jgi:acylphosphatase